MNTNVMPSEGFESSDQTVYLPKDDEKPYQENQHQDMSDPLLLKQQDTLGQPPAMEQGNPANMYNMQDKGAQSMESIFPYGLENKPPETNPNLQPMPQVSMNLSDIDLENLLGRMKTQSSDIPPEQIQFKATPQMKKRELSDTENEMYQELFGSKDSFADPNNSKNKDESLEKSLNPPKKQESNDSLIKMLNLGLEPHPTS